MNIKKHIPNALTCLNLLSGMIGIYYVIQNGAIYGAYFIFAAAIFDFLDGFAARLLKVQSAIGKELDSLADLVTFGVLPAFILFLMIQNTTTIWFLPYFAFIIGIQSALRLANFNIDEEQEDRFIGLPTPANALFISTLPFLGIKLPWFQGLLENPYYILAITFLFAYLLTAALPLLALKFKNFEWSDNKWRYLTLIFSAISIMILGIAGIPMAILSYICLSVLNHFLDKNEEKG
ncbi:MAG: CDP-diacylglycerol--serine O-phosphatidyltransferase [Cyclobacteriaceae bacterium]